MHAYAAHGKVLGSLRDEKREERPGINAVGTALKRKGMQAMDFSYPTFKSYNIKSQATEPREFMFHKILVSSYHESSVFITVDSMCLLEGRTGALENDLGPGTGPSSSTEEYLACLLLVPPGEIFLS